MKTSTLKYRRSTVTAALLAAALALPAAALAAMPLPGTVSGTVTSVSGSQIVVNGVTYSVAATSAALGELRQVQPGQQVDLVLNGPPGSAATQVVDINVHKAP